MRKRVETHSASVDEPIETDEATASSLAGYIAELTAELARMAERSELTMLAHFLNLARVEAEFRSRELAPSPTRPGMNR